jgi:hypothetical protein
LPIVRHRHHHVSSLSEKKTPSELQLELDGIVHMEADCFVSGYLSLYVMVIQFV